MKPSRPAQPTFAWPIALVLAPILVLAAMGWYALQVDQRTVAHEAQAQARELAISVAAHLDQLLQQSVALARSNAFTWRTNLDVFAVDARGQLETPPPLRWPPEPAPLPLTALTASKPAQWTNATAAFDAQDWRRVADLYLAFLDGRHTQGTQPTADQESGIGDRRFRSLAQFRRGLALERLGDTNAAIAAFNDVFEDFILRDPGCSEAGLPWKHLAALKILNLAHDQPERLPELWRKDPELLAVHLSQEASPYGGELFQRLAGLASRLGNPTPSSLQAERLLDHWLRAERGRRRYAEAAAARKGNPAPWPTAFWVDGEFEWLAVAQRVPSGHAGAARSTFYGVFPQRWLEDEIQAVCRRDDRRSRFGVAVRFDLRSLVHGLPAEYLAPNTVRAAHTVALTEAGSSASVTVALANPAAWFATQRKRQFMFSCLIAVSVGAGLFAAWATYRALRRQQRLAELRSNFVSSVSHELRAPIASVRLMAESLERGKVPEPMRQREYFRFIGQECRRLSSLIENVLDFARIEQGRKQYEFEPTDLLRLVQETVRLLEPSASEKQVRLMLASPGVSPATHDPQPMLDGRAIQQALINLVDNAVKHSPAGESVAVELQVLQARGTQPPGIALSVADHGPGIPREEHERIFERFYRRGSELRRETQGVGIGLSIVKHIVDAHGGRIRVESEPGQGSRFTLELPLAANGDPSQPPNAP